jgi:hypothetical protein
MALDPRGRAQKAAASGRQKRMWNCSPLVPALATSDRDAAVTDVREVPLTHVPSAFRVAAGYACFAALVTKGAGQFLGLVRRTQRADKQRGL